MTSKTFFISNLIILAFLINFIITSLLFLSSLLLLLLLLLLKLFYDHYVIIITYFGLYNKIYWQGLGVVAKLWLLDFSLVQI